MHPKPTHSRIRRVLAAQLLLLVLLAVAWAETPFSRLEIEDQHLLDRAGRRFTGDLAEIRNRRFIRALVNYSKTNFFIDEGRLHGFEYELLKAYEKFLNRGVNRHHRVKLICIPVPFEDLFDALNQGRGDIAAAGLTVTPAREKKAAFSVPYIKDVREVAVRHKAAPSLTSLENLGGREVYVRPGSSYVTHLAEVNKRLASRNMPQIRVRKAARYLVTEDILELVNAGAVSFTVADQHIAEAWARALPRIAVQKELTVHSGGKIAWAVRKNNPKLRGSVNAFMQKNRKGKLLGNILFGRYFRNSRWIRDPHIDDALRPAPGMMDLFRKYGEKYDFNPLLLMAMAYRESGFDQSRRSHRGAVGVMQILPETAAGGRVNIRDIGRLENNIHAGVKYLNYLRTEYFDDPHITKENRDFFALAAYNAGPSRLKKLRKRAGENGFDPDKWFFNVERTAAAAVGREVVDYVADVYKYFIVYQLQFHMDENRKKARRDRLGG